MVQRFLPSVIDPVVYFILALLLWSIIVIALAKSNCKPKDCFDLKCYRVSTSSDGPHLIYPERPRLESLQVLCDHIANNGGWILFQRRLSGLLDFNRTWAEYRDGFGKSDYNMELWLGNENVREVILSYNGTPCELRIEGYGYNGSSCYIEASNFRLDSERDNYALRFDGIISAVNASGTDLMYHRDLPFKTFDANQGDPYCASEHNGGWWYRHCAEVFLNGPYKKPKSMYLLSFEHAHILRGSRMLFRPTGNRVCDNPCEEGGTCEYDESTDRHRCICPPSRCGVTCETVNPCENGGTCAYNDTRHAIVCACAANFTGFNCSIMSDHGLLEKVHQISHASGFESFIFLLAIIVVLAAVAFYSEQQARLNEEKQREVEPLLFSGIRIDPKRMSLSKQPSASPDMQR